MPLLPPHAARILAFLLLSLACRGGERPNIVHIIVDDLGWGDVGFHGSEIATPNLDRLSSESTVFNRFYVSPICSPTRAGALTGRYPFRFGIWDGVCSPTTRHGLPPAELTLPELLGQNGYPERALMGKWHLGLASTLFHPLNHGFTRFYGHYNGAIDYFSRHRFGELDWHRDHSPVHEEGYATDLIGRAASEFIRTARDPYYLLVAFNAPHSPLQAKPEDLTACGFDPEGPRAPHTDAGIAKREKAPEYGERGRGNTVRQTFAAMTRAMDRNLGLILEAVRESGHHDNTIVFFHSDNGGIPKHGGSNHPLRGHKFTTWEGGVRVVAMMRWPARLKAGTHFEHPACYLDLLPTLAAAAGTPPPEGIDGLNLLPQLEGRAPAAERAILLAEDAIVTKRWKLRRGQLFDLLADQGETRDLADQHPETVARLQEKLSLFPSLRGPACTTRLTDRGPWPPHQWTLPREPSAQP